MAPIKTTTDPMQWYAYDATHGHMNLLPHLDPEYPESGASVDVLVFGYINNLAHTPAWGIGYVDKDGVWFVSTTNGTLDTKDEEITVLMWAELPDQPCDVPSVKNNDQNDDL